VTVLHEGRVLCEGSVEQVQADDRVREVYLGRARDERSGAVVVDAGRIAAIEALALADADHAGADTGAGTEGASEGATEGAALADPAGGEAGDQAEVAS